VKVAAFDVPPAVVIVTWADWGPFDGGTVTLHEL